MRLAALQSVMNTEVASVLGYSLPPGTRCFQRLGGFSPVASPGLLRSRVHPLVSFTPSSEYVPFVTCPTRVPSTFQGSPPIRDMSIRSPLFGGIPLPPSFRPQRFSRSRRFAPPKYRAGLFHPTATSGIRSSGVFPAAKPSCLIDKPYSHAACGFRLPVGCPAGASSNHADFRVLIRAAIRCSQQAV
jgi:hypothetical protein